VSDYVNEDIRNGRISRDEGIALNEKYDGTCADKYINSFCAFIGITVNDFWKHVDKAVNPVLFAKDGIGKYTPKFKVGVGL
jgi:hypothetical protein